MEKINFRGYYIGLDQRTGSLAIVPTTVRVEKPDDRGHLRVRDLDGDEAAKAIHKLLGAGKSRKWIRVSIEEV